MAEGRPPPVALFTAAVSPPHIYAAAVMRLYLKPGEDASQAPDVAQVMQTLRTWDQIPKELLMQVSCEHSSMVHCKVLQCIRAYVASALVALAHLIVWCCWDQIPQELLMQVSCNYGVVCIPI